MRTPTMKNKSKTGIIFEGQCIIIGKTMHKMENGKSCRALKALLLAPDRAYPATAKNRKNKEESK